MKSHLAKIILGLGWCFLVLLSGCASAPQKSYCDLVDTEAELEDADAASAVDVKSKK